MPEHNVCDWCGASMPLDTPRCPECGKDPNSLEPARPEPELLPIIKGWLGPKCLGRFNVQSSLCQYCPARLICADRKVRGVATLGSDVLWVAIPVYEGIIEEIGLFDSKDKAVAWLKQATEGDLDDEDRVCDGDWAGSSIEEVIVQ